MAIYLEEINDVGLTYNYNRIKNIEYDFDNNQISIILGKYVSEEFRNKEKQEEDDIKKQIKELKTKKDILAEERESKLQELESKEIKPLTIGYEKYTFEITDQVDIRNIAYKLIMERIPGMEKSKEV